MPPRGTKKTTGAPTEESTTTSPTDAAEGEPKNTEAQGPDAPLTDEQWAQARTELIAALPEEKDRPQNIYGRLAQINRFIHRIRKTGWNAFHQYKYVKEADLVEAIRPILAEYGIWFEHGLHWDAEQGIVGHQRLTKTLRDRQKNITGETEDLTAVTIKVVFVWWNEATQRAERTEPQFWAGYGDDAGDKGIYKALTGAEKYALMKTFLVSTGDDPEGDENTDRRAAAQGASRPVTVERGGQQGKRPPAQGGKQQQTTEPQRKVLKDLLKHAGVRTAKDVIEKLQAILPGLTIPVDGEDYAGALAAFMEKAPGTAIGTAIAALRTELGMAEPEQTSPIREEDQQNAEAPVDPSQGDIAVAQDMAGESGAPADGWENEDPEGSNEPADDGALTGDDEAAV